jgi:flagellar hook-associated protein 3 FlgL
MRVTERSRIESLGLANSRNAERLDKAAKIAASNQRVSKPSDDPAAYGAMVRRNYDVAMLDTHAQTAQRTQGELEIANNALSAGVDVMERAQEAAVQGANATSDANSRKILAQDVRAMRSELMSIGNTKYGNRYIFAGTKADTIPFDEKGDFKGNDQQINVPVMDGVHLQGNVSGAKAFTAAGGRDVFGDLQELADALDSNDQDRISKSIDLLTKGHDQIVRTQVEAGYGARRFADAIDVLGNTKAVVAERESNDINGDMAAQITDMQMAKNAYERSMAVTKQILSIQTPQ